MSHNRTVLTLLVSLLFVAAPVVAAASGSSLERVDGMLNVMQPIVSAGDLVLEGDVSAAPGVDLVIEAAGDIIVRGRLVGAAANGAGLHGGAVILRAGGAIVFEPGAIVEAGAGGHGLPADVPGGYARGGNGGNGGSVVITALRVESHGDLAPGMGGRGGDAFGRIAFGGDGGSPGAVLVNGERGDPTRLVPHPEAQAMSVCPPADIQPPQVVMGAPGGNACADGIVGTPGAHGQDGQDDETLFDTASRPDCPIFVPGWQDVDGEQGQNGFPGVLGGPAVATGGRGGDAVSTGMQAGNGGSATAKGGKGGNGGWGGMGGHANGSGYGCRGGNGGNGGNGGSATATAGAQGLNPLNCSKNGNSGSATATGGAGGAKGYGGAGGGGLTPSKNGPRGTDGYAGTQGYQITSVPPTLPCLAPDAPTIVATDDLLTCDAVRLAITEPAFAGNSQVQYYKVYRGTNPSFVNYIGDVIYGAAVTLALDAPLVENTTYYYRAKAVTAVGESPYSYLGSATPVCLLPGVTIDPIGTIFDPMTSAPLLAATAGVGGTATLTITSPPSIVGTPLHYNVHRGPSSGNEVFVTTVPYGGATTTWTDSGLLPLTAYWYYVTLTTSSDTSSDSNHVAVVTPLLMAGGGGSGTGRDSTYESADDPGKHRSCSGVPVTVSFTFADGSFVLDARYGKGTGERREDSRELCDETDARSVTYGSETTRPAPGCEEDGAERIDDGWIVTRSCKGADASANHRVILREMKEGGWSYSETVTKTTSDGRSESWSLDAKLGGEHTGTCTPRALGGLCL